MNPSTSRRSPRGEIDFFPKQAMPASDEFLGRVASPRFCERLFARLPDVVFCMKDVERRYQVVNQAFAARLGIARTGDLLGKRAEDVFPPALAETYREQDETVLKSGTELSDRLELVTNRDGSLGWYLATKVPVHDAAGVVIGLASISRDLGAADAEDVRFHGLQRVVRHIHGHLDEALTPMELAALAGCPVPQLERKMRRVFELTVSQFVRKARIGRAAELLRERIDLSVAEIALECGYGDQSAFGRQFRSTVGQPPAAYRQQVRAGNSKR